MTTRPLLRLGMLADVAEIERVSGIAFLEEFVGDPYRQEILERGK